MNEYLSQVNAGPLYLIVALVLAYITAMCLVFLLKSYRAGIKIGMDKKVLNKTILSSATFTLLPSVSILLGVVALSGTLGVPFSWLRFAPLYINAQQYASIHGLNENISRAALPHGVDFYKKMIQKS